VVLALGWFAWTGIGILGLIILLALAFWPARVARRKGHTWLLYSSSACSFSSPLSSSLTWLTIAADSDGPASRPAPSAVADPADESG
jgi:hypothetical protein